MIDERRVREMACEYDTNLSTARKLLESAQDVPALRRGRWYKLNLAAAQIRKEFEKGIDAVLEATEATARIQSAMTGGDAGEPENSAIIQMNLESEDGMQELDKMVEEICENAFFMDDDLVKEKNRDENKLYISFSKLKKIIFSYLMHDDGWIPVEERLPELPDWN